MELAVPGPFDLAFAALLAVVYPVWEYRVAWPRVRAALLADVPGERRRAYVKTLGLQWVAAGIVIASWTRAHRPWRDLLLTMPAGWRLAAGLVLVAGVGGLAVAQAVSVARLSVERRAALAPRLGSVRLVLPHTTEEWRWFLALGVTAGVCEELLYRGFLVWVLQPWLGLWPAAAVVVVLFGAGHAYQGRSGVIKATAAGAVMGAVALLTGSLIPGMIMHAALDLGGGTVGYLALSRPRIS